MLYFYAVNAEPQKNFSGLVRDIRAQLKYSQEDLARELGVSFATVNRWENGHTEPSKMARNVITAFCKKMTERGVLRNVKI
jgi:DNA-binding transcriptional regulator YiaG